MSSRVHWSDLQIGVIAAVAIAVAVLSVLLFARVGALHGDTQTVYVMTDEATGVLEGTEVWFSGQKIGLVKAVRFRPITTDTLVRIAIETEILADRMHLIRRDSYADIRPGGNFIGSPVVYIGPGTSAHPALRNGDTIATRTSGPIAAVGTQLDTLGNRLNALSDSSQKLIALLSNTSTSIGTFRSRGMGELRRAQTVMSSLADKARGGNGTLALASRGSVGERVRRIIAQKDSVTTLLSSGRGNLGRFHRDSTLLPAVTRIRAEVDSLRGLLLNPNSEVARLRSDTALKSQITKARAELDSLMKEVKKHPTKFISF
jgi:phospholipid/cholesterol/gamma-HCH transport system substrate-binding protein